MKKNIMFIAIVIYFGQISLGQNLKKNQGNNGLWGFVDVNNNPKIPAMCNVAYNFYEGLAYIETEEGFKGFIDANGKQIIDFKNKFYLSGKGNYGNEYGFKNGFLKVEEQPSEKNGFKSGEIGLINKQGNIVVPCKYIDVRDFSEGMAAVEIYGPLWGYVDTTGKEIITPKYYEVNDFNYGIAKIAIGSNSSKPKYGFIDKSDREIIPSKYQKMGDCHEGMIWFEYYGAYGFVMKNGNEIIPAKYDKVDDFKNAICLHCIGKSDTLCAEVHLKNEIFYLNKKGELIKIMCYSEVGNFFEGLASFRWDWDEKEGKQIDFLDGGFNKGYTDKDGNEIIKRQFDVAENFHNGIAKVGKNDKYGFIDKTGKEIIPIKYDSIGDFHEGLAWFKLNGKYGFVDKNGNEIIPASFDGAGDFSEGMAVVKKANGLKENVTQKFSSWDYQNVERKYSAFGYIDKQGTLVIGFKYSEAGNFKNGKAKVFIPNEGNRFIDKKGSITN